MSDIKTTPDWPARIGGLFLSVLAWVPIFCFAMAAHKLMAEYDPAPVTVGVFFAAGAFWKTFWVWAEGALAR